MRSYTPITSDEDKGYFDLLVKAYAQGNISAYLAGMKVGESMKVKGPKGAMVYSPNLCRRIGMVAGGTGITPMLQIIRAIVRGRPRNGGTDTTKVDLIFANVNPEDILLKDDLDQIVQEDDGITVYYVLNNPPEGWTGGVGFVTAEMLKVREHSSRYFGVVLMRNRSAFHHQPTISRFCFVVHHQWSVLSKRQQNLWVTKRPVLSASLRTKSLLSKKHHEIETVSFERKGFLDVAGVHHGLRIGFNRLVICRSYRMLP